MLTNGPTLVNFFCSGSLYNLEKQIGSSSVGLRNLFITVVWWGNELGAGGRSTKLESQTGNACEAACTFILVMIKKNNKEQTGVTCFWFLLTK